MVEVWEKQEDTLSQVFVVDGVLAYLIEFCSGCGTSVVTAMVFPVIVVSLDEEPFSGRVVKGINMSSSESVSGNYSSLVGLCSSKNDVSKGANRGVLQVLVSTIIVSTLLESISGNPGDLLVSDSHLPEILNKTKNVAVWPSLVFRK
jgi:hypothetical protein